MCESEANAAEDHKNIYRICLPDGIVNDSCLNKL